MLFVKVKKLLQTIKKKDFFSENDLFVRVVYGNDVRTTTIKWNTRNPLWNESFVFDIQPRVSKIILQLFEQGMYKAYRIAETSCNVNLEAIRSVKKGIFCFDMGHMFFTAEASVDTIRSELNKKTAKITHLINTINGMQEQITSLQNEKEEAQSHHQRISSTQENTIGQLRSKLAKIMDFLEGIKSET